MLKFFRILATYLISFIFILIFSILFLAFSGYEASATGFLTFLGPLAPILIIERKYSSKKKKAIAEREKEIAERKQELRQVRLDKEYERSKRAYESDKALLRDAVKDHQIALKRNLRKAIKMNDYGASIADERELVISEFLASVSIFPIEMSSDEVLCYVEGLIATEESIQSEDEGFNPNRLPTGGHEFEEWVAKSLNMFGWEARVTQGSGDQGVDVLASKDGKSLAIQCKLYSQPVGNKAVQEAFSGAKYYDAEYAAVLTNAGFTASAKDLALSTDVKLLSPEDIPKLKL